VLGVYVYTINAHVLILTLYTQKRGKKTCGCVYNTNGPCSSFYAVCVYWREENGEAFTGKRRRVDRGCSWAVHLNPSIHYKRTFGPCWDVPVLLGKYNFGFGILAYSLLFLRHITLNRSKVKRHMFGVLNMN
jgi:hypothetical protein